MTRVGSVAQRLEQGTHNPLVLGSNPSGPNRLREAGGEKGQEEVIHGLWAGYGKRRMFFLEQKIRESMI